MADDVRLARLLELLPRALQEFVVPEEAVGADVVLNQDYIETRLRQRVDEIWRACATQVDIAERARAAHAAAAQLRRARWLMGQRRARAFLIIGVPFLLSLFAFIGTQLARSDVTRARAILLILWFTIVNVLLFCLVWGVAYFALRRQSLRRIEAADAWERVADRDARAANDAADRALIEQGIIPELREYINAQLAVSYDPVLRVQAAGGLAEVFNPQFEIVTAAKEKLDYLIGSMPGGSIGIAGPRGVGKTTLIHSYCEPLPRGAEQKLFEVKGRPALAVMLSAPVEYEARDFILHIFASVCQRVIDLAGGSGSEASPPPEAYPDRPPPPPAWNRLSALDWPRLVRGSLPFLVSLGVFFIVSSILLVNVVSPPPQSAPAASAPEAGTPAARVPLASTPTTSTATRYVTTLGIKPSTLFFWGVLLAFGTQAVAVIVYRVARRSGALDPQPLPGRTEPMLVRKARGWLHEARFQQSYSSGWGGSLKVPIAPIAFEGKVDSAISLAERQRSLPEIVGTYRRFVEEAAVEYQVVIGIDELDKLASDEQARRFLNDIKALFGLEKCFYLLSVSESAMSAFERRGLPFRDVFDSSFDAVIRVGYLTFEEAQALLKRRIIGLPVPFACLCYCISGGLARDLIRNARDLFELVQRDSRAADLASLCDALVGAEVRSKLAAVRVAALDIALEPEVNQLLESIRHVASALASPKRLLDISPALACRPSANGVQNTDPDEMVANREKLAALSRELGTYLYFCATVLEFFSTVVDPETWQEALEKKDIERLAEARQALAGSPHIARMLITDFRCSRGMLIPSFPDAQPFAGDSAAPAQLAIRREVIE